MDQRFNPVAVRGELSGFSRAASGHCYFNLKDPQGQIRCAMFRRAASLVDFSPRDGDLVEVRGRLGVYEPRGDLQLVVESLQRAGQGALFEQFALLKARLEAEGLFDTARKRPLPLMPRGIGIVTSLGAAALHDVATALRRRAPHVPVVLAPALVQGEQAPADLVRALESLYALADSTAEGTANETVDGTADGASVGVPIDAILLVRGGGSIEDLWAFNDERLARCIVRSPVPIVSGVGHETDFTIADFVADLRAPTPTSAAELVAQPQEVWLSLLQGMATRLRDASLRTLDTRAQRLDQAVSRLGRPSELVARQQLRLARAAQQLDHAARDTVTRRHTALALQAPRMDQALRTRLRQAHEALAQSQRVLDLLDPRVVLRRGYSWLADEHGHTLTTAAQATVGSRITATLSDGEIDAQVLQTRRL